MKTTIAILALSLLLLNDSCTSKNDDDFIIHLNNVYDMNVKIFKDSSSIMDQYRNAYGIGKSNDSLFKSEGTRFNPNTGTDLDTFFNIPLNLNKDTTGFVFVSNDGTRDTVILSYHRKPVVKHYGYNLDIDEVRFVFLSDRLDQSLCFVSLSNHDLFFFEEFSIKLFRK